MFKVYSKKYIRVTEVDWENGVRSGDEVCVLAPVWCTGVATIGTPVLHTPGSIISSISVSLSIDPFNVHSDFPDWALDSFYAINAVGLFSCDEEKKMCVH